MNVRGALILLGLYIIGLIVVYLYDKYGPDDKDDTTPPGFRWGD